MARFDSQSDDVAVLAVDIGGANLKIADGKVFALTRPFPLWRQPDELVAALQKLFDEAPPFGQLAVTMTGELADCFATKAVGVQEILDSVEHAAKSHEVCVYLCDGRLVPSAVARREPLLAAASNWHVLATFATRFVQSESGLLVDVGSTTTDIISLSRRAAVAVGQTDPERLVTGELVYTGVERSPLCAVVASLKWRGESCPVAQEVFATTSDAYLLLGELFEDTKDVRTADGRPRTIAHAHARMARMICADTTMFSLDDAQRAAQAVCDAQTEQLAVAARRVIERTNLAPAVVVLSGQGEFLARRMLGRLGLKAQIVSMSEQLGPEISRAACAHALAVLVRERDAE